MTPRRDHSILQSNWKQVNDEWVKDNTFTFTGTDLSPNWDVDRKDSGGNYVSVGASYTKGSKVKVEATFAMDFGGKNWNYQIVGIGANMLFQSGTLTGATGSSITMTSSVALPNYVDIIETDIDWAIIINGTTTGAGTSGEHTIYVTMGTPGGTTVTEKRLGTVCQAAKMQNTEIGVADKIWAINAWKFNMGNPLNNPPDPSGAPGALLSNEETWKYIYGGAILTYNGKQYGWGGDCAAISKAMQVGCDMIGLGINGSVVYLYPEPGKSVRESLLPGDNTKRWLENSFGEIKEYTYAFRVLNGLVNNYESCFKIVIGGQLRYYAPGTAGTGVFSNAQSILNGCVITTLWTYEQNGIKEHWPNNVNIDRPWLENPPPAF